MKTSSASLCLATAALWLTTATTAFATGSMQCEGISYAAEVQFQLSTGELTALVIAYTNLPRRPSERFTLQRQFVDYKRQRMDVTGAALDEPARTATLNISGTEGTLTYRGARHRLRCDWNNLG